MPTMKQVSRQDKLIADSLDFSRRAERVLRTNGITTVGQLAGVSESYLKVRRGIGNVSIKQIKEALVNRGMTLASPGPAVGVFDFAFRTGCPCQACKATEDVARKER